jgi:NADH:ubiquinone oxidoreductase subunit 5 (subunit L)/multisubunit Na+/H+ antiporter MnhA subunit
LNKAKLLLTKLWIRGRGKYLRIEPITLPWGETKEVIIFTDKKLSLPGQATPFGTVIMHEKVLTQPELKEHVSVHEFTHLQKWYTFPLEAIGILSYIVSFLIITSIILYPEYLRMELAYLHINHNVVKIITAAIAALIGLITFWIAEYKADCRSIHELGPNKVLTARAKWELMYKRNLIERIISFLTHPPIKLTIRICLFFDHKLRKQKTNLSSDNK